MARIRTIKPEFFRHEAIYDAEIETGLPLRLAFIAIWTVCDREGRFRWRPRALKVECLPYDDCDFSRVLDALATRGFLVHYEVEGVEFGFVPSFSRHQFINNRENPSDIPKHSENNAFLPRQARVPDACSTVVQSCKEEGKGREREEEKKERKKINKKDKKPAPNLDPEFVRFWTEWPNKVAKPDAVKAFAKVASEIDAILAGVESYIKTKPAWQDYMHPATFLNGRRWEDAPQKPDPAKQTPASSLRIVGGQLFGTDR